LDDESKSLDANSVVFVAGHGSVETTLATSVLCNFVAESGDTPSCPGAVTVESLAIAVDPKVNSTTGYHDVYLYFTTLGSSRNINFYEFHVDSSGNPNHQENAGVLEYPNRVGSGTNADTFNMVVGEQKSSLGSACSVTTNKTQPLPYLLRFLCLQARPTPLRR
jgi:hypothetical protein